MAEDGLSKECTIEGLRIADFEFRICEAQNPYPRFP